MEISKKKTGFDLNTILKGFLFKKDSNGELQKFLPHTEASLVTMENGNDAETEITKIIDAISKIQPYDSVIESGSVLDIKATGIYFIYSTVTDKPKSVGDGMLLVSYHTDDNRVYTYIGYNNVVYVRHFTGGKDSDWICKDNDLQTAIDTLSKTIEERTNGKIKIYSDAEGGNIGILSPNNIYWEMDAVGDDLRLYTFWKDNKFTNYIFRGTGVGGGGTVALTKEVEKKMDKMTVVNNATTTVPGTLLDGRMGKTLNDSIVYTQNYIPEIAKNNFITNALLINTNGQMNNHYMYPGVIATEDASKISGSPVTSGAFYAYREVFFLPNQGIVGNTYGKTIVRLTEAYPISGRVWITSYNTDIQNWSPWQEHAPFYANEAGIGSAYGVNASYKSSGRITTVYFNGQHVGDSMPAYSQRNMGTLPSGKRPSSKVQCPVTGINGLYLTVEPSGVVSMRNEHYETISFSPIIVSGSVTFVS